jgi:hypothetical protein
MITPDAYQSLYTMTIFGAKFTLFPNFRHSFLHQ